MNSRGCRASPSGPAPAQLADRAAGLVPPGAPVLLVADPGLQATGMIDDIAAVLRRAASR